MESEMHIVIKALFCRGSSLHRHPSPERYRVNINNVTVLLLWHPERYQNPGI